MKVLVIRPIVHVNLDCGIPPAHLETNKTTEDENESYTPATVKKGDPATRPSVAKEVHQETEQLKREEILKLVLFC